MIDNGSEIVFGAGGCNRRFIVWESRMEKIDALIWVVDDHEMNRKLVKHILSKEYRVECMSSGTECLEKLKTSMPDLILLDNIMPGMSGFDVLKAIKANPDWCDVPVIFLTADLDHESEIQGLELGAMDFIRKPFRAAIMMTRVSRVLELSFLQKNLQHEVEKQTAVAEERRRRMEEMSLKMVDTLAVTLEAKDAYTNGHSSRVADYSVMIGKHLGWSEKQLEKLYRAALLHDIGKIGVPDKILNKEEKLDEKEYATIKSHTVIGSDILETIETLELARIVANYHHERYDGRGYPIGLKGEEIPLEARIVGVADAFDAMNSKRIYRNSLPMKVIREELVKGRGTQFDPDIDDIFLKMIDNGEVEEASFDENASESAEK